MATSVGFQLGILPERKMDRRALAASYGLLIFLIIMMINIGWIWPDSLNICTPSPREPVQYPGGFDIIHLDFIEEPPKCSPGTARAPYFMINPMYYVEFQIDVR